MSLNLLVKVELPPLKKVTSCKVTSLVVLVGFEPTQTEPESGVLPLHHRTIPKCDAKVLLFSEPASVFPKKFQKKLIFSAFFGFLPFFYPFINDYWASSHDFSLASELAMAWRLSAIRRVMSCPVGLGRMGSCSVSTILPGVTLNVVRGIT